MSCGSVHTYAWSALKPANASRLSATVPMEFNHLHRIPLAILLYCLILLHLNSELFCMSLPTFDLTLAISVDGGGLGVISY